MAEFRREIKWILFVSSYIPLYFILIIKSWNLRVSVPAVDIPILSAVAGIQVPVVSILFAVVSVSSYYILEQAVEVKQQMSVSFTTVEHYQSRNDLITSYLLVYIFPFVVLDYTNILNWIAFGVFFIMIGYIQVRSNQLYVNPVLAFRGYNIYEIDTGNQMMTVIVQGRVEEKFVSDDLDELDIDTEVDERQIRTVQLSNDVRITV